MSGKTYRVYISSTHNDLHNYREAVADAITKMGMLPISSDEIGLSSDSSDDHLNTRIGDADIFIGIYAHHYGMVSPLWDMSLTEMEYKVARDMGKKCLFFMVDPTALWRADHIDRGENGARMDAFKQRIRDEASYHIFTDQKDLHIKTLNSLHQIVEQIHRERGTMVVQSIFGTPLKEAQFKADAFMIMPFREKFEAVYRDHIKPMLESHHLTVIRGDDFFSQNAIMDEVWSAIFHAQIVIAECTDRNPNVFYELGIAHAIGKPSILIVQDIEDIPFDLRHLRIIVYDPSSEGLATFEQQLGKACQGLLAEVHG